MYTFRDNKTSSILVVPSGSKLIEALVTSPICQGEGGNMVGGHVSVVNIRERSYWRRPLKHWVKSGSF